MSLPLAEVMANALRGAARSCGPLPCGSRAELQEGLPNASVIQCQGGCSKRHAWANALGPVMQCPAALTDKFGCGNATDWCDSGKYTCGLQELAARRPCVIISLGSSNEWDFERDIFMRTNCRILVFDCMCDHCVVPASIRVRHRPARVPW